MCDTARKFFWSIVLCVACTASAHAVEVGMGLRAGTLGGGIDLDIGLSDKFNLRFGYNYLSYDETVEETDVSYDGTLDINSFSTLIDWHVVGGGFRLTVGAIASGPKIDVVGTPTAGGTYQIGDSTYTAAQIGSLQGEIKVGNSVAPYVGIGYGNVVGKSGRVSFLFDLGAMYGGTPEVTLTANCNPSLSPAACATLQAQLNSDLATEIAELEDDAQAMQWYPVISVGLGIRF